MTETAKQEVLPSRDKLRELIFTAAKPQTREIEFFGQLIELRQPPVGEIENMDRSEGKKSTTVTMLVQYAYVPGTNVKVFDETDLEVLRTMPWGPDFSRATNAIMDLTGIDVDGAEKNSK